MKRIAGSSARAGRVIAGVAALLSCVALPVARGAAAGHTEVPELALDLQASSDKELLSRFRLGGDAELHQGRLRLTKDAQSQAGWVWSKAGTPARMEDEWSMEIDVLLHGKSSSLSGDGMAIWLATRPLDGDAVASGRSQSLGPNFGMPARFAGLGLFLDTFDNAPGRHSRRFPYIAGVFLPEPQPGQPEEEYAHNAPEYAHAMDASQGCTEVIRSTDPHGTSSERTVTLRLQYEGPPPGAPRTQNSGILSAEVERMGTRVEAVGEALNQRLASGLSRLEETLSRLGRAEKELDERLQALADRTAAAEEAAKVVVSKRGGWFEVTLVLVVAATAVAGGAALFMACTASERLEKPHSL